MQKELLKDINSILIVLGNYFEQFELSDNEYNQLGSWLYESKANQELFDDLQNQSKLIKNRDYIAFREKIRMRIHQVESGW